MEKLIPLLWQKDNIKSQKQVRQWSHNYQEFGDEGVKRSRKKKYISQDQVYKVS